MLRGTPHRPDRGRRDRRAGTRGRGGLIERAAPYGALVALLAVTVPLLGCPFHKAKNPDLIGKGGERVDPKLLPNRTTVDTTFPPNAPSFLLATVPEKSVGPFLARHLDTTMAVYVGPGEGAARRIISLPIGGDGAPFDPQVIATASEDATTMVVRSAGGAPGSGGAYVVAWTDLTDRGEALSVAGVTALGKPRSPSTELTRTQDDIVWIEVLPTPRGEVVVWVEEARSGGANLFAVALDPDGRPRGVPSAIVKGIVGWQAVATAAGAGIATLTRTTAGPTKTTTTISWLALDADARATGTPLVVGSSTQRIVDVDVAAVGPDFVFSWTRRGAPEPEVMVASVDAAGVLTPAHSITARSGGASLVDAVGGVHGGVLAWEETTHLARGTRRLHLVPLTVGKLPETPASGTLNSSGVIEVDTAGVPEIVPLDHGYAVLARLRTCADPPIPGIVCDDAAAPAPTFVRLDARFAVVQTEPILVDQTQAHATLAWGLSCSGEDCLVLAAGAESPAVVRVVKLSPGPNRWRSPLPPAPPADAPRVLAVDTIASSDLYSEIAVAEIKGVPVLAAITTESAVKTEGVLAATVSATRLDAPGAAQTTQGPAVVLTHHARPEGGVSIAAAEGLAGGAVAWVGRENGHAAVHVTRIDGAGKRTNDVQLTTAHGDASDVALAWAGGGWVVAWVDTRDGNGEVYATKIDADLRRIAREVRVTNAPGDASDVTVLAQPGKDGPVVWVAWADPRESPHDGVADIYVARLNGKDATPLAPEQRVLATVPHSRSPALTAGLGSGVTLGWIEEAPSGADPAGASVYGAMIGVLDDQAHLAREPLRTRGAGEGFPTSIALERSGEQLHIVVTRSTRDDIFLDAMTLEPGTTARPYLLFGLEGPPSMDVALGVLGDEIYFNDQSEGGVEGRVRRATVQWKH